MSEEVLSQEYEINDDEGGISSGHNTFDIWDVKFYGYGIQDPQTIFALVVFLITVTLFIGKICCGWFARYTIYRRSPSLEGQELSSDTQTSEAYLPPVLQSSYRVGETSETDQATNLRRRHYGLNDHVIDSDNLRQSDDVIVEVPAEPSSTGEK